MTEQNRRLVLAERPSGMVNDGHVKMDPEDIPSVGSGEALAKVRYLSIDPTIRTWMDDAPGLPAPDRARGSDPLRGDRRGGREQLRHLPARADCCSG